MRTSLMVAALGAVALVGCGGPSSPKYYKVAIDASALSSINPTNNAGCYVPGTNTDFRSSSTSENLRGEYEYAIWDGVDGKQYLELPRIQVQLGDSPTIDFQGLVEGNAKDLFFLVRRVDVSQSSIFKFKSTTTTSAKLTFKDFGSSTSGTIDLNSSYNCAPNPDKCPDPQAGMKMMSCSATIPFVARQIPVVSQDTWGR